jgi:hypothetical protein
MPDDEPDEPEDEEEDDDEDEDEGCSTEPPQAAGLTPGAATSASPRRTAPAVTAREPSPLRRAAPQKGQWLALDRACRLQAGHARSVSRRYMP